MPTPRAHRPWWSDWRAPSLAAAISLLCASFGVFSLPPLDRDESRFAQASLQMLETGDFVRIKLQQEPRNKKPAGIYWLQAASTAIFSTPEARAIWSYRLPSVLAAVLTTLFAFHAGVRLVGREAAALGVILLAASVLLSTEGMIAKTDAALSACVAGALWALSALRTRQDHEAGRGSALGFWAALAAGVLIKGPIAPMIAVLALITLAFWERRWAWAKPLLWPPGLGLFVGMLAPWLIAITIATDGRFFADALGADMGAKLAKGAEGHGAPPGLHLLLLPLLGFPLTLGLIPAARLAWTALRSNSRHDGPGLEGVRFLCAWIAPSWFVFELAPTKLAHYALPLYAAVALLVGSGLLRQWRSSARPWASLALFASAAMLLLAVCAAASTLLYGDPAGGVRRALQTTLTLGPPTLLALGLLAFVRSPAKAVLLSAGVSAMLLFAARERIAPEARQVLVAQQASQALERLQLHPRLSQASAPLLAVGFSEPSFVFLTRTDTRLGTGTQAARLAKAGEAALVESRERRSFETALQDRGLCFQPLGLPVMGLNYSKGDPVQLQPGRIRNLSEFTPPHAQPSEQAQ